MNEQQKMEALKSVSQSTLERVRAEIGDEAPSPDRPLAGLVSIQGIGAVTRSMIDQEIARKHQMLIDLSR